LLYTAALLFMSPPSVKRSLLGERLTAIVLLMMMMIIIIIIIIIRSTLQN